MKRTLHSWSMALLCLLQSLSASAIVFTNDTLIGPLNTNYDGQDIVISNSTLTVDGPHGFASLRAAGGSTLTHSATPGGTIVITASVTNEAQVLTGTNAVGLVQPGVFLFSVMVSDLTGTITYTNTLDYLLSLSNSTALLQRTESSSIPDGATVLVSYDYSVVTTNAGLMLSIVGDLEIEPGAAINANGRGFSGPLGPGSGGVSGFPQSGGGAGYGGTGGLSASNSSGGAAYGAVFEPSQPGSCGGNGVGGIGGAGGGLIRLSVGGRALIHGAVTAGGSAATNSRAGGGSGGSIWIDAATVSGSGVILVNGGAGEPILGGGGGGGRVAVEFATNEFVGTVSAFGGAGWQRGGAGTIFWRTNGTPGKLIFDNGGLAGASTRLAVTNAVDLIVEGKAIAVTSGPQSVSNLTVRSGSSLTTTATNNATFTLTIWGNAAIEQGALVVMNGNGYSQNQGSGMGSLIGNVAAGGGGHGGYGGSGISGANVALGGIFYGSLTGPITWGSGGRSISAFSGGAGGGAVRFTILGVLRLDGEIHADATGGAGVATGGGAGGSVWLTLGGFSGNGLLTANGGSGGLPNGGGGAGGRIAITYASNTFGGSIQAHGGIGAMAGGPGTIYTKATSETVGSLLTDNGGLSGTNTWIDIGTFNKLTVAGGAKLRASVGSMSLGTLTVASNSSLLLANTAVTVTSNAFIEGNGSIFGDGLGPGGSGSGLSSSLGSGGGGHAGYGGRGLGAVGGNAYGFAASPTTSGSSGGSVTFGPQGTGGAALRLTIQGSLLLDGKISSEGSNALTNNAGGGSGGSIWLTVLKQFSGSGTVSANGGSGILPNGGGGGGGRIAIYYLSNSFNGLLSAKGGLGFVAGGAGTIYLKPLSNSIATFLADNGGTSGTNTLLDSLSFVDVTVGPGAVLAATQLQSANFNNLIIASNGTFLVGSQTFNVTSNTTIAAGGKMSLDSTGPRGTGSGLGLSSSAGSGGGGHAGRGGDGAGLDGTGRGGITLDSASNPLQPGGGGGGFNLTGGAGGGALRLTVGGILNVEGRLSANGQAVVTNNAGGGAGGSLWLTVGGLTGNGIIAADGGSGHLPWGGGGGGGRIAVYYWSNTFSGNISAKGGAGFVGGGAGTLYFKANTNNLATLIADNGGMRGTNTAVSVTSGGFDAILQNGALAMALGGPRDLLIRSNAWLRQSGDVTVTRNVTVQAGGGIDLDGLSSSGSGNGSSIANRGGGGGYGGYGGFNLGGAGNAYGSAIAPIAAGSAGGNNTGGTLPSLGGYGGGAVHLNVTGILLADGRISANGASGGFTSGGGSGGSLWLTVGTLAGAGQISANGGNGNATGGGGAGGRIAINYATNLFTGSILACGGLGADEGGAGTIYSKATFSAGGTLLVHNCGLPGTNTPLSQTVGLATNILVTGGAVAEFQGLIPALGNLTISGGGRVTGRTVDMLLDLGAAGDVTIDADSTLDVDGKGFGRGAGPGVGGTLSNKGAGGGYGGNGGNSASGAPGGTNYGSAVQPVDRGSGGGSGLSTGLGGSEGGGVLRLNVGGTLLVNGRLSAKGNPGLSDDAGGGSGGSVWLNAARLAGAGSIQADGGDGELFGGGGGGGGRIALYSPMNTFTGLVSTAGGMGAFAGGTGTVFSASSLLPFQIVSHSPTGILSNVVNSVLLNFSAPINPSSVNTADVLIMTPNGALPGTNLTLSLSGPAALLVFFPPQNGVGTYTLEIGPGIEDLLGQPMSQVYTGSFALSLPLISGTVTDTNGQPVSGVSLQPSGGLVSVLSDVTGGYALGVPPGWNGTVTPSLAGSMFVPGARSYTNVQIEVTAQDYVRVATIAPSMEAGSSGGNFGLRWYGISGVTYQAYWSTNLANWNLLGLPIAGTNGLAELLIPITDEPAKFFRLGAQN